MGARKNLVLGGSGTIGKPLCQHLASIGEQVVNLDIKEGFDLRTGSLDSYSDVDYVWFLAWEVGGAKYLSNPDFQLQIIKNNILICNNVFNFLEKNKIPFIFTSSQLAAIDNNYGITKILGEAWANELGGKIARFWNVYGWEEPGEKSHVIPDMIIKALTTKNINLITDGTEERQFIYVDDCIRNLVKYRDNNDLKMLHLSNGKWISIADLAQTISMLIPANVTLGKIQGYNNRIDPDSSHTMYEYSTSIEEGIKKIATLANEYVLNKKINA